MNIELRNISINQRLSEETNCYTATLYLDGKAIAEVGNRGCGGPDEVHHRNGCADALAKVEAYCKSLPPIPSEYFADGLPMNLELWCGLRVDESLYLKDLRRLVKTKILFKEEGKPLMTSTFKGCKAITPAHIKAFRTMHPAAAILNDMPEAEALALFKAA
jgi:hypothetical protein